MDKAKIKEEFRELDIRIVILEDKVKSMICNMKAFGMTDEQIKSYNEAYFELKTLQERRAYKSIPDARVDFIKSVPTGGTIN